MCRVFTLSVKGCHLAPFSTSAPCVVLRQNAEILGSQVKEEFSITVWTWHGRSKRVHERKPELGAAFSDGFNGSLVLARIPYDPPLAHGGPAYFELRLDQGEQNAAREREWHDGWEDQAQADE